MASTRSVLKFRRRREGKTNYKTRLALLKSGLVRAVIRKSLRNVLIQFVEYSPTGDKILLSVSSRSLIKHGWNAGRANLPAAYLTGLLAGKLAQAKIKNKKVIADIGMQNATKGNVLFAAIKGLADSGLDLPHDPKALPPEDRLSGKHIVENAKINAGQFTAYKKNNVDPTQIDSLFNQVKEKIEKL